MSLLLKYFFVILKANANEIIEMYINLLFNVFYSVSNPNPINNKKE
jgi:hypothetical protein